MFHLAARYPQTNIGLAERVLECLEANCIRRVPDAG